MTTAAIVAGQADFESFRVIARGVLARGVTPEDVEWRIAGEPGSLFAIPDVEPGSVEVHSAERPAVGAAAVGEPSLASPDVGAHSVVDAFGDPTSPTEWAPSRAATPRPQARVPREFLALGAEVACHADRHRYGLLYRMLWRMAHGEPDLLARITDADVHRANAMAKSVRRDVHKMKAFVRFRAVRGDDGDEVYVAWFEPEHHIVERCAPFFARRFAGMRFSILTPTASAHWDRESLRFGPGANPGDAAREDTLEDLWRTYYASIFNPARLNVRMMRQEMPQKYWRNLPEASLIGQLVQQAAPRSAAMIERGATRPRKRIPAPPPRAVPDAELPHGTIAELRDQAAGCRACPLWQFGTQTVFGEGPARAQIVFIGEQPGDKEDLAGRPFVGPAGQLFDRALAEAGVSRAKVYVTNAVKHFKFEPRGKFRLHKRANAAEQAACRPWLEAELAALLPKIIVCLGSMAAEAIFGKGFGLLKHRGEWRTLSSGAHAFATVHPSFLLRQRDEESRRAEYARFVEDLRLLKSPPR